MKWGYLLSAVFYVFMSAKADSSELKYYEDLKTSQGQLVRDILEFVSDRASGEIKLTPVTEGFGSNLKEEEEVRSQSGKVNMLYRGASEEHEKNFISVPFPIYMGLLGIRAAFIHKSQANRFMHINDLSDLQSVKIVQGRYWMDTRILKQNQFSIHTPPFASMIRMVNRGRADAFMRGIHEIYPEFQKYKNEYPFVLIDENILLSYRMPVVLYLNKTEKKLQETLQLTLKKLFDSGEYQRFFLGHSQIKGLIEQIHPKKRKVFRIENPFLPQQYTSLPDSYWLNFIE